MEKVFNMDVKINERELKVRNKTYKYFRIEDLESYGYSVKNLPFSLKIMIENLLRRLGNGEVKIEHIESIIKREQVEIPFYPERVILQDYTGVPVVIDLIAMRNAVQRMGRDPNKINPVVPVDLVIDHSLQVDYFGTSYAIELNKKLEYERNGERYSMLKWATKVFRNFRVVPPGNGIIHQINTEYLSSIVMEKNGYLFPETLIGTDSHTTMINGLGILGWGVGGIEAEAVVVGEPIYMEIPRVVGVKLTGQPKPGVTATDIVLSITQFLRSKKVVGKFVEFIGEGIKHLSLQDRTTISNMAPEYGATAGLFPVDEVTLSYMKLTGREKLVPVIEKYMKEQGLFYTGQEYSYDEFYEFDLSSIEPCVAGPKNPDERIPLKNLPEELKKLAGRERREIELEISGTKYKFGDFSVSLAAITSCTNTSNPFVLMGAGLIAKNAVERGLKVKPFVKTSLAPGSVVVTEYLKNSGLLPYLEALGFHVVGYGCTTCIGNSGPLVKEVEEIMKSSDLYITGVLSGNRNFEGRINPYIKGAFLASPMLVVVYALSGRMDIDFEKDPVGLDPNGKPVYLKDIWPSDEEIRSYIEKYVSPDLYKEKYKNVFEGDENWKALKIPEGEYYEFDPKSTYIREPPWFSDFSFEEKPLKDIINARILAIFGDNITTDHISPAGVIVSDLQILKNLDLNDKEKLKNIPPAAIYLLQNGVKPEDFNTYGSRRGNHEVMVRGGFANVKIKNKMVERMGGYTKYYPDGEEMSIYDAAMKYMQQGIPLVIFAGKRYGQGSSRDWAAKATALLGVRAIIAEGFERIHRSNLVDMGVLPIQIPEAINDLKGDELVDIIGIGEMVPKGKVQITIKRNGNERKIEGILRVDTKAEVEYIKNGGILKYTLKKLLTKD